MDTVEDIILDRDGRNISALRPHIPARFCDDAATMILDNPGTVLITTGFYILLAGATETDGPPGAIAIGNALQKLGYEVIYVTDKFTEPVMSPMVDGRARVIDFPILDHEKSKQIAADMMSELNPSVLISIERCGLTASGDYLNFKRRSIAEFNAKLDYLFHDFPNSVGIGDGGNEIGMGNCAEVIPNYDRLSVPPCVTETTHLIISSVSNWGGYGLAASLSKQSRQNVLPTIEEDQALIKKMVDLGGVDGMENAPVYKVDGFSLEENSETIRMLNNYLASEGV
ncbi:MAG: DUF4392 domain-containing protein [SAR202 cluster bacterium]|nr:DUF4392 domain-containing protein [SAR202 cluster bacterium]|tara:strand:- start:1213 stop:2064 length:852 start_codon:yes stop_codon:yes gene_type:complete